MLMDSTDQGSSEQLESACAAACLGLLGQTTMSWLTAACKSKVPCRIHWRRLCKPTTNCVGLKAGWPKSTRMWRLGVPCQMPYQGQWGGQWPPYGCWLFRSYSHGLQAKQGCACEPDEALHTPQTTNLHQASLLRRIFQAQWQAEFGQHETCSEGPCSKGCMLIPTPKNRRKAQKVVSMLPQLAFWVCWPCCWAHAQQLHRCSRIHSFVLTGATWFLPLGSSKDQTWNSELAAHWHDKADKVAVTRETEGVWFLSPFFCCSLSLPFFFPHPLGPVVRWSFGRLVSWPRLGLLLWSAQFFLPVGPLRWSLLCLLVPLVSWQPQSTFGRQEGIKIESGKETPWTLNPPTPMEPRLVCPSCDPSCETVNTEPNKERRNARKKKERRRERNRKAISKELRSRREKDWCTGRSKDALNRERGRMQERKTESQRCKNTEINKGVLFLFGFFLWVPALLLFSPSACCVCLLVFCCFFVLGFPVPPCIRLSAVLSALCEGLQGYLEAAEQRAWAMVPTRRGHCRRQPPARKASRRITACAFQRGKKRAVDALWVLQNSSCTALWPSSHSLGAQLLGSKLESSGRGVEAPLLASEERACWFQSRTVQEALDTTKPMSRMPSALLSSAQKDIIGSQRGAETEGGICAVAFAADWPSTWPLICAPRARDYTALVRQDSDNTALKWHENVDAHGECPPVQVKDILPQFSDDQVCDALVQSNEDSFSVAFLAVLGLSSLISSGHQPSGGAAHEPST